MNSELRDILFIDIETVAATDTYQSLHERLKVQWSRKAGFLRRDEGMTDEDLFHHRAGIYAEFGKIICIVIGKLYENEAGELSIKTKALFDHDEAALLREFKVILDKMDSANARLCAHNGKEFDFPYLCRRMIINNECIPDLLSISGKRPWEVNHLDTMELWRFGDYKSFTSLNLLAHALNIPTSKDDIDGSMVGMVYWKEKNLERIVHYCQKDVVTMAQIFLRLNREPLVSENNIEIK